MIAQHITRQLLLQSLKTSKKARIVPQFMKTYPIYQHLNYLVIPQFKNSVKSLISNKVSFLAIAIRFHYVMEKDKIRRNIVPFSSKLVKERSLIYYEDWDYLDIESITLVSRQRFYNTYDTRALKILARELSRNYWLWCRCS